MFSDFMDVPDHIYLKGPETKMHVNARDHRRSVSTISDMFVPEKITVGKGGKLVPHPSQPIEVVRDKPVAYDGNDRVSPAPLKLTANDYPAEVRKNARANGSHAVGESQDSLNASESITNLNNSLAVDLDPLRELKNVRRQLGRLATRVLELEDENQRRTTREYGLWTLMSGTLVILAFLFQRK